MTILRSKKYLSGSRGETCKLRIAGVCRGETETVVPCHARDRHTGRSIRASDLSVIDGCRRCHDVFDRRARLPNGMLLSDEEWHFYALRGLQDTLERRREIGLLFVPEDAAKTFAERPVKPRKPPEQRRSIPQGRKLTTTSRLPTKGQVKFPRKRHEGLT